MKLTKKEAKARKKLFQEWHMNKRQQRNVDRKVKLFCLTYGYVLRKKRIVDPPIMKED